MQVSSLIAKHFRELHFGGNWTCSNLKEHLSELTWEQAITKVEGFNTIAALTYHTHYYVHAVIKVLLGGALEAKDEYSFNTPVIQSSQDWHALLDQVWSDAERFASLVEQLPDERLWEDFTDKKYGNYYRNLHGIIEHTHYHLGQIVLLKKMLQSPAHPGG